MRDRRVTREVFRRGRKRIGKGRTPKRVNGCVKRKRSSERGESRKELDLGLDTSIEQS